MKQTKILITYGPACQTQEQLRGLIRAGANAIRYNFSHGNPDDYQKFVKMVRELSEQEKVTVAILADLQGPKIRCGVLPDEGVMLKTGDSVLLGETAGSKDVQWIPVSQELLKAVEPGHRILFNDGRIEAEAKQVSPSGIMIEIKYGGMLHSRKGINFPDSRLAIESLTPQDRIHAEAAIKHGVDYIALSFVRSAEDIKTLRELIKKHSTENIPIIAKIEKPEAVHNLREILGESEGVMVARGDLGVETSPEAVPILQKNIIAQANHAGRLVITATQMLESMINSSKPTRAEATDVANAILDGTDVVMLSGETAQGEFPQEAVSMMSNIIKEAESFQGLHKNDPDKTFQGSEDFTSSICRAAVSCAENLDLSGIVVFTQSGATALYTSKFHSMVPVIAFTPNIHVCRRCALYRGVYPFIMEAIKDTDKLFGLVDNMMKQWNMAEPGDQIAVIFGSPIRQMGYTNTLKLHAIGEGK